MSDLLEFSEGVFQQTPLLLLKTPPDADADTDSKKETPAQEDDLKLLHHTQISTVYHEPFILGGYRTTGTSFVDCVRYTFVLHNDVGNFWTHFVPFVVWAVWLGYIAKYTVDFSDPYYYPLLCLWAGACSYAFFSSVAHAFSCKSFVVRSICFIMDYLGIAMYCLGGSIAAFFYQQSVHSSYYSYKYPILLFEAGLAVCATLFCGLTRFYWKQFRFIIRILSFVLPYITAVAPFLQRFERCVSTGEECIYETLHLHLVGFLLTGILTFFFATKIPERCAPGKFDYFFQSHQIFHVAAALQTTIQMYMIPLDASLRRDSLETIEGAQPDVYTTFVPFLIGQFGGLLVVCLLGYFVVGGVLSSNKLETHPHIDKKTR